MATPSQISDHVSKVRQAATTLLECVRSLDGLRKDWDYLALGESMPEGDLSAAGHPGLEAGDIAGVYTTLAAVNTLLDSGHGTNLAKVRVG